MKKRFQEKLREKLKYTRLRTLLLLSFVVLSIIPLIVLGCVVFIVSRNTLIEQAKTQFIHDVQKTSTILDKNLDYVEEFSLKLNIDARIYEIFENIDKEDPVKLNEASDKISQILLSYLPWNNEVYSAHLVTSFYRFGEEGKNFYPKGQFIKSDLAKQADQAEGELIWVPTYDYATMFGIDNMSKNLEYSKLFSAVRKLHPSKTSFGRIFELSDKVEEPYLVVNFTEQNLRTMLMEYVGKNNSAKYFVQSKQGKLVCSSDENWDEGDILVSTLKFHTDEGSFQKNFKGQNYILAYSKSRVTGWYVVAMLPVSELTDQIVDKLIRVMAIMIALITFLDSLAAFYISRSLNRKVYKPLKMIERVGAGDFDTEVQYNSREEFAFFYSKLNEMNHNLKRLVHENYEIRLQKRDSEIMALNIQLNPHFLYNSLNIINWLCLNGDSDKASNMIVNLSRMLQYTSKNNKYLVPLKGDMEWLMGYLSIMERRYERLFKVSIFIPDKYNNLEVPKLFLQPFVENAIVHAFKDYKEDGLLEISVEEDKNDIIFFVEDNGCGISQEKIEKVMHQKTKSIGISNTNKRLRMIYGPRYGVTIHSQVGEGTTILIRIPNNRK